MPELPKLVALADLFGVSLDYLVREDQEERIPSGGAVPPHNDAAVIRELQEMRRYIHTRDVYEYRSKTQVFGIPLVHIRLSRWGGFGAPARGIIALGNSAIGVVAVGGAALGVVSLGGLSAGLLFALGGLALGGVALGGVGVGLVALGGVALGMYALGGVALAQELAMGGVAVGRVAVGDVAQGEQTLLLTASTTGREVAAFLGRACPRLPEFFLDLFSHGL